MALEAASLGRGMYTELGFFINGRWEVGQGASAIPVINPATEEVIGQLPQAGAADLESALSAAEAGFKVWRTTAPGDRAKILNRAAGLVRNRAEQIARIMVQEQGKVFAEAKAEVLFAADVVEWFGEEARRAYGRVIPGRGKNTRQFVVQEPVGVAAAFTPWNFPALTPARKIAAAVAAGCAIIIKASEETPGSCIELVRCLSEAGLPPGVVNLVFGVPAEISGRLIASRQVRKISFTGSVAVGKELAALAAKGMKRATMELGGHAPVVVFADCDVEKVAERTAAYKYRNAGQICISPSRFYVHEQGFKKFVDRFVEVARGLKVGNGLEEGTVMGPLANSRRLQAMERLVEDAKQRGGVIETGGARRGNRGFFFEPTVVTDVPDDSRLMTDEPFGPIAPIVPFKTFDEVVARTNSLPYGLAAYAFTNSTQTANAIGDALEAGMVGVNSIAISNAETPFGGVKESGYGYEGGTEGLEAYTVKKLVVQA